MCNLNAGVLFLCLYTTVSIFSYPVSGFILDKTSPATTASAVVCEDTITECAVLNVAIEICNDTAHAMRVCARYCGLCPRDGDWGEWGGWGGCDVTCGNGTITRTRLCDNPTPKNGGMNCSGSNEDYDDCERDPCPVDGEWGEWGSWSDCSMTCGSGLQKRRRDCDNPPPSRGGLPCPDDPSDYQICMLAVCTDTPTLTTNETVGGWGSWGNWSTCSASCGTGVQRRERACDNPAPTSYTGRCEGDYTEFDMCFERDCTGEWSAWGNWTDCSVTCGIGLIHRERECQNADNKTNGVLCLGDYKETNICTAGVCESNATVANAWGSWSNWSACSVTCGIGLVRRQRECYSGDNITLERNCMGDYTEADVCTMDECGSNLTSSWGMWSNWSICSVTCGTGSVKRHRECYSSDNITLESSCMGDYTDTDICTPGECENNITSTWGLWSNWSACSVTCGTGLIKRQRDCYSGDNVTLESSCVGDYTDKDICEMEECGSNITSEWGLWSNWSDCSVTCGTGLQRRQRECYRGHNITLENSCIGDYTDSTICTPVECERNITSEWGMWSNWSACSVSCGTGLQRRQRECYSSDNITLEDSCIGDYTDSNICSAGECDRNITSSWGLWSNWSDCSVTCGTGLQRRHRECYSDDNVTLEYNCIGDYADSNICTPVECESNITSEWGLWSNWSGCSVSCGTGLVRRQRECYSNDNVTLEYSCIGDFTETNICLPGVCENNATTPSAWGLWSNWSTCSVTCGTGLVRRQRECYGEDNVTLEHSCVGDYTETDLCTMENCDTNGTWGQWSAWGMCSVTCGTGLKRRERSCVDDDNGTTAENCAGDFTDFTSCIRTECEKNATQLGSWSFWGQWSSCSASCGTGLRRRERDCYSADNSTFGSDCFGDYTEMDTCYEKMCLGNAAWGEWGNWSSCSVSCDIGVRTRERECYGSDNVTLDNSCLGVSVETDICLQDKCKNNVTLLFGDWGQWENWSHCSVTCGPGLRRRERNCFDNVTIGDNCIGDFTDFDSCFELDCENNTTVIGDWGTWGNWSGCSVTCGLGLRRRERECYNADNVTLEDSCIGDYTETDICIEEECVNNQTRPSNWGVWGNWSSCNPSCGPGLRRRERDCYYTDSVMFGSDCMGDYTEFDSCFEVECEHNATLVGEWGVWGNWSICSVTCGIGLRRRERDCFSMDNVTQDYTCHGDYTETDMCIEDKCTSNLTSTGDWGTWGDWSSCSVTCGIGLQRRERECYSADNFTQKDNCMGDYTETNICMEDECISNSTDVNTWGLWGNWSGCSSTCGPGLRRRVRNCFNADNTTIERTCIGDYTDFDSCYGTECNNISSLEGHWDSWGNWSDCSATCGYGVRRRDRDCSSLDNSSTDTRCTGDYTEYDVCVQEECKTSLTVPNFIGEWESWQSWEPCSVSCGVGIQKRMRECHDPSNVTDTVICSGESLDIQVCTEQTCAGNGSVQTVHGVVDAGQWTDWQDWSACSVSCGNGMKRRERQCNSSSDDATSSYYCIGDYTDVASCVEEECSGNTTASPPFECHWSTWGDWSECSVSCGAGIKRRDRNCSNNDDTTTGVVICRGDYSDFDVCVLAQCSGDMNVSTTNLAGSTGVMEGNWTVWGNWSHCSVTCGYGLRRRQRVCYSSQDQTSLTECSGDFSDFDSCYEGPCGNDSSSCSQVCNTAVMPTTNLTETVGGWGSWGNWSTCSASCGTGVQRRERACDNPAPTSYTGRCEGQASEFTVCTTHPCASWGGWSNWTDCSSSCGYGLKLRHRECQGPNDGKPFACTGDPVDRMICAAVCPDQLEPDIHGPPATTHSSSTSSAFSATISAPGDVTGTVRFLVEHVNTAQAYDSKTGAYTAPVSGLYFFSTTLSTMSDYLHNHDLDTVECQILQNVFIRRMNLQIDPTDDDADKESYSISASLVLHLFKGDTVQIGECTDPAAFYSDSSFTGFLISPDP